MLLINEGKGPFASGRTTYNPSASFSKFKFKFLRKVFVEKKTTTTKAGSHPHLIILKTHKGKLKSIRIFCFFLVYVNSHILTVINAIKFLRSI